MNTYVTGFLALIGNFLRNIFSEDGGAGHISTPGVGDEDRRSITEDDSITSASVFDDDDHSATSMSSDDGPLRGMWDVTSIYYSTMHSDDLLSTSIQMDDTWMSSSSSSMFDDSLSSSSSISNFGD